MVSSEEGIEKLQSDLKKLYQWACDWQMLFNVEKCKVIHFGHSNDDGRCVYTFGSNVVKVVKEERDFGAIVHKSLKPTSQCIEAIKSANKTLGMISGTFMFKDKNTMLRLYKSLHIRVRYDRNCNIQSRDGGPTLSKT